MLMNRFSKRKKCYTVIKINAANGAQKREKWIKKRVAEAVTRSTKALFNSNSQTYH